MYLKFARNLHRLSGNALRTQKGVCRIMCPPQLKEIQTHISLLLGAVLDKINRSKVMAGSFSLAGFLLFYRNTFGTQRERKSMTKLSAIKIVST